MELPVRAGHVERHLLPAAAGAPPAGVGKVRRAALLRRALRYRRGQLDVLPRAGGRDGEGLGGAHAAELRVLAEALSEVHAPEDVREGDRRRRLERSARRTSTSSGAMLDPLARAGKLGALLAQFPASFKNDAGIAGLPRDPAAARSGTTASPWSSATGAGATSPKTRCSCSGNTARPGPRSTSRSSACRSGRTCCRTVRTFYYLRLHGRNAAQWWAHDQLGRPLQLPLLRRRTEAVRRGRGRRLADRWRRRISTRTTTSRRSRSPTPRS